jgi:hypothetical protein
MLTVLAAETGEIWLLPVFMNSQEWRDAEEDSENAEIDISGYLSDCITDDRSSTPGYNNVIPVNNATASRQINNEEKYISSEESDDHSDDDDDGGHDILSGLNSENSSFLYKEKRQ